MKTKTKRKRKRSMGREREGDRRGGTDRRRKEGSRRTEKRTLRVESFQVTGHFKWTAY